MYPAVIAMNYHYSVTYELELKRGSTEIIEMH